MEPKRRRNKLLSALPFIGTVAVGYIFFYLVLGWALPEPEIGGAQVPVELTNRIKVYNMNTLRPDDPGHVASEEKVLILTPMSTFYPEYWQNLVNLDYPHELIDVGFIVPNNGHGDKALESLVPKIKQNQADAKKAFRTVNVLRQDTPSPEGFTEQERHEMAAQKDRRSKQSLARNSLLFTTMGPDHSWVLWIDADIVETPKTLIQDMVKHDKDVLVANCYQRFKNDEGKDDIRPYDYNSWIDSDRAKEIAKGMGPDEILLEGYAEIATYRTLMAKLYSSKGRVDEVIELDGVGGTALMVRADVHRDGAMFPPFPFYHLIETEGFAKMAQRLNYKVWGLPNYLVYHYNE